MHSAGLVLGFYLNTIPVQDGMTPVLEQIIQYWYMMLPSGPGDGDADARVAAPSPGSSIYGSADCTALSCSDNTNLFMCLR